MENYFITIFFLIVLIYLVQEKVNHKSTFVDPDTTTGTTVDTTDTTTGTTVDTTNTTTGTTDTTTGTTDTTTGTTVGSNADTTELNIPTKYCPINNSVLLHKNPIKDHSFKNYLCDENIDCSERNTSQKDSLYLQKNINTSLKLLGDDNKVVLNIRPALNQDMKKDKELDLTDGIEMLHGGGNQIRRSYNHNENYKKQNKEYNKTNTIVKLFSPELESLYNDDKKKLYEKEQCCGSNLDNSELEYQYYKEEIDNTKTQINKRNLDIDISNKSDRSIFPCRKVEHVWNSLGLHKIDEKKDECDGDNFAVSGRKILPFYHMSMVNNYNFENKDTNINDSFEWNNILTV